MTHSHRVTIYYEDTDLSGAVYHANYLKYFERAREQLLGPSELARIWQEEGVGFAVYKLECTYRAPAGHGDVLEVRTRVEVENPWRTLFYQSCWREGEDKPLVEGLVQLVCIDHQGRLVRTPEGLYQSLSEMKAG
jgi:tol-pal system-associated acyl-CoA thioesterase